MQKRHALIISLLITFIIIVICLFFSPSFAQSKKETAVIARVIDGDTLVLKDNRTLRLLNINAPEKDTLLAIPAYEFLKKLENKEIKVQITSKDKYNRYLARIYAPDYLNLELVKQGFSSKFLVDKNELKDFAKAERNAINNEKGIWKRSQYSRCFNIKIDQVKEIVLIENTCNSTNLDGWIVKDESRKMYTFPSITAGKISLHSSNGTNNLTDLFWDNKDPIWNDDRDSFYLWDSHGKLAAYYTYGY